jgi:hypothetical protein
MYSRLKVILIAGIILIVGAIGGTVIGFELSSRFWHAMSQGTEAAPGALAYFALGSLDRKEEAKLREFLEFEIDSTLSYLRAEEASGSLVPGTPTIQLYEDLRRYRKEHPFDARTNVITTH